MPLIPKLSSLRITKADPDVEVGNTINADNGQFKSPSNRLEGKYKLT